VSTNPSEELSQVLIKQDKERVMERQQRLGPTGLEKLHDKVNEAKKKNDVPVPVDMVRKFKVPEITDLQFIPVVTIRNGKIN